MEGDVQGIRGMSNPINDVSSILSTSSISIKGIVLIVMLTLFISADQYRINIVSTLCASNLVYIVHIVDIAMLFYIELTSCRHRLPLITFINFVDTSVLYDIDSTFCQHSVSQTTFTSFTSSTFQCCTLSNKHRVDIANL